MWNFIFAVLLVVALIQKAAGATINVLWTTAGTAEYTVNSPLLVKMGDYVVFSCNTPMSSSIWILKDKLQYDSCNCSAIPEGCNGNQRLVSPCTNGIPNSVLINKIDSPLASVFDYFPGETYYLVDFAFFPRMTSGGNCQTGPIKLVMKVVGLGSKPDINGGGSVANVNEGASNSSIINQGLHNQAQPLQPISLALLIAVAATLIKNKCA